MQTQPIKTHNDGIWVSLHREIAIVKKLNQEILNRNFVPTVNSPNNYGVSCIYQRDQQILNCRLVDSVFLEDPDAWVRNHPDAIITDNIPLNPVPGNLISVVPEFWSIWRFKPVYIDRPATIAYNCFMNRPRGDRSIVFYELYNRNILTRGLVSYNVSSNDLEQVFVDNSLNKHTDEHKIALNMVPYNTLTGTLEQCIIDCRVSLVLETYISDSHIVFSEKLFRALQMPRPWLLYCSHGSVETLRKYGFDVLDDYVNHDYDQIVESHNRLNVLLDQLESFIDRRYSDSDYQRFNLAAKHNQQKLMHLALEWPTKFQQVLDAISKL